MANPNSRSSLLDYCLRKLGAPVLEVNVDADQLEDRIDEALQVYQEYHSDATVKTYLKHLVTTTDVTNKYIPISSSIIYVSRLLPFSSASSSSSNMFGVKYQMMLNDISDLQNFAGDLAYYEQMQQYLSLLDMQLNGTPTVNFARHQNRLNIFGDFEDQDIKAGQYVIAEVYQIVAPNSHVSVYNDMWLKDYTTQLIKQQWGANLIKFEGMQLPGGVTLNGRQIYDDATAALEALMEKLKLEHELPPDFYIG
jgi:hypothetical protein|tara:strand:- start:11013 stop:11768 length:756 start_codon:yes stop_codon:yes gene_type:complete